MSQIPGLKFLIQRDGEGGKLGEIRDAVQVVSGSSLIPYLLEHDFYLGAKEEWEEFTGLTAGDFDHDGDYDYKDQRIIRKLKG